MKNPPHPDFPSHIKRRRALPLASTATATAIGLAGCSMFPSPSAAPATSDTRQATKLVQNYTSDIEVALDKVDRERLRAAAEKKNQTIVQVTTSTPADVAASSAGQDTVVLASSTANDLASHTPAAAPTAPPAAALPVPEASIPVFTPVGPKPAPVPTAPASQAPAAAAHPSLAEPLPAPVVAANPPAAPTPKFTPAPQVPPTPAVPTTPVAQVPPAPPPTPAAPAPRTVAIDGQSPMAVLVASPLIFPDNTSPMSGLAVSSASSDVPTPPSDTASVGTAAVPGTPAASAMVAMTAMPVPQTPDPTAAAPSPEASMDDALAVLRRNVGEHPTLSTALAMALLDNGKSGGGDLIKSLSPADQKVATDLLAALDAMKTANPTAALSDRAAPLVDAAAKWQAQADLQLPRMVLATRVDSFGVFTETAATFEQGKRHTVIIYCEVANFGSLKDTDWYTTRLSQQESLITEDGLLVWRPNPEDIEDRSKNQRHDFYLVKKLTLPETLAAGKYTLRMTVTDKNKNKTAVISRPLEIVLQ